MVREAYEIKFSEITTDQQEYFYMGILILAKAGICRERDAIESAARIRA